MYNTGANGVHHCGGVRVGRVYGIQDRGLQVQGQDPGYKTQGQRRDQSANAVGDPDYPLVRAVTRVGSCILARVLAGDGAPAVAIAYAEGIRARGCGHPTSAVDLRPQRAICAYSH